MPKVPLVSGITQLSAVFDASDDVSLFSTSLESTLSARFTILHCQFRLRPTLVISYSRYSHVSTHASYAHKHGFRVPEGELTVDRVAELVGRNRLVNTIDVSTQVIRLY